jgi:hypothetical protein
MKEKKKPGELAGNTGQAKLVLKYTILKALQRPFLASFWFLEQRMGRLRDQIANLERD